MNVKKNPTNILNYQISFFGKRGFSTIAKAEKFTIKLSWMRKPRAYEIKVQGRKTKKKVTEFVLQIIHKIESERSFRLVQSQRKQAVKRGVSKVFEPYNFKVSYFEQTFFSKKLGSYIQSNKLRYTYKSKFLINERNYLPILKQLYKVVEAAAQDYFIEQNGWGDYIQVKVDCIGLYDRNGKKDVLSFAIGRTQVHDPDYIQKHVKAMFIDFLDRFRSRQDNYFKLRIIGEEYYLAGFTIDRVIKLKV